MMMSLDLWLSRCCGEVGLYCGDNTSLKSSSSSSEWILCKPTPLKLLKLGKYCDFEFEFSWFDALTVFFFFLCGALGEADLDDRFLTGFLMYRNGNIMYKIQYQLILCLILDS